MTSAYNRTISDLYQGMASGSQLILRLLHPSLYSDYSIMDGMIFHNSTTADREDLPQVSVANQQKTERSELLTVQHWQAILDDEGCRTIA